MIFQLRYNTKLSESLNNSKDYYSMQNTKWVAPRPNQHRLEHLQFTQRNKPRAKYPQEMLLCLVSKGLVPIEKQRIVNLQSNDTSCNYKDITSEIKQENHPYYGSKLNPSMSEVERQNKKVLPPLQFIAVRPQIRTQSKDKDPIETSTSKSCKLVSPMINRSDQKKNVKRSESKDNSDQIGRTSSTPFIHKTLQNDNLTSRSGSPNQRSSSKPTKTQKINIQPKLTQINERRYTQNHQDSHVQPQSNLKMAESTDKKLQVKRKKRQLQTTQQQQILQQQNSQKDKLNQKHTSYRCFINKINFSNNQCIQSPLKMDVPAYYFYVGKGNNGSLLKNLFRQRWWWQEVETLDMSKVNMAWTQLKQNTCIECLPTFNMATNDTNYNNDSFIQSIEETVVESSDSELDIHVKPRSVPVLSINQQLRQSNQSKKKLQITNLNQLKRIFNQIDLHKILAYMEENNQWDSQIVFSDCTEKLLMSIKGLQTSIHYDSKNYKMHNHMQDNWHLGNKKALFYNMRNYFKTIKEDYTKYIPITFHIQKGMTDTEYFKFVDYYNKRQDEIKELERKLQLEYRRDKRQKPINLWIVKPGECTNRGNGITVCQDLQEINKILNEEQPDGRQRTYIVQQYIDNPFLYNKRKFDIRCYMLLTSQNGIFKGYWYQEGYIRTSSKEFTTKCLNKYIHLTNDAVQSKDEDYGKFEFGNKISFLEYQRYLDTYHPQSKFNFFIDIYPKMKNIALDLMKASYGKIDPQRRSNSFELFGLDFMIDDNFKLWLIEANTNPCLELSCPLLSRIIPAMVENLFRIAIDPIFPPPYFEEWPQNKRLFIPDNVLENNRFDLIFDELIEKKAMINLYRDSKVEQDCFKIEEEEEEEEKD
ncbi:unnamed protein product [Paramecium pentaurelia]|uniref:Tubulin-tyrosine ligase family protein n=1 Tax=Paramecium pentaurelia TaxID=43138 RepID=A0A8S1WWR3_9CILI|nr:unnamed protein product [Paramecium pentaurelia]